MRRAARLLALLLIGSPALVSASPADKKKPKILVEEPPSRAGVPVAPVSFTGNQVEYAKPGGAWERPPSAYRIRTGDRLRTGPGSVARLQFPWMSVTAGPSSRIEIPAELVLSTVLEEGRLEVHSDRGEIVKVRAGGTEVRGSGRAVIRRHAGGVSVSALDGGFRVESQGTALHLSRGLGVLVPPRRHPGSPVGLLGPPRDLSPGADPRYVVLRSPVQLLWTSAAAVHHVQLLSLDLEEVLLEEDVRDTTTAFAIPWLGTFRWRVSALDEHGLDGIPSTTGLVCVVEK